MSFELPLEEKAMFQFISGHILSLHIMMGTLVLGQIRSSFQQHSCRVSAGKLLGKAQLEQT